jgi:hypothetical protein
MLQKNLNFEHKNLLLGLHTCNLKSNFIFADIMFQTSDKYYWLNCFFELNPMSPVSKIQRIPKNHAVKKICVSKMCHALQ